VDDQKIIQKTKDIKNKDLIQMNKDKPTYVNMMIHFKNYVYKIKIIISKHLIIYI